MLPKFPLIVGPTAGGKSTLAINLAHHLTQATGNPCEILTMDSMQIFRRMDIGTAKPTPQERQGIPHHLIDLVDPTDPFSVEQWLAAANPLIDHLRSLGTIPIVVGGTHLYAKALLEGLFEGPPANDAIRAELAALPLDDLRAQLEAIDPAAAARIHRNDTRRTIRALEVHRLTGTPISEHQRQWDAQRGPRPDATLIGIDWPSTALNPRINARVGDMVAQGFVDEVQGLLDRNELGTQAREALGYKQIAAALEAPTPKALAEALEQTKIQTRRFAKNQRTWLRRLRTTPGSLWIDAAQSPPEQWAAQVGNTLLAQAVGEP